MILVSLPRALTTLFPGCPQDVPVEAATVQDAMEELNRRWPGLRDRLCNETPSLRRHIRVFARGEIAALETRLSEGDEVFVVTAISGG